MGIPKVGIEFYIKLKQLGLLDGFTSVMELGSQDIVKHTIDAQGYCDLFNKQNIEYYEEIFAKSRISARILYDDLGFEKYACIDLDEGHGAYKFDLNYNFKEKYGFNEQFDLIFNGGTTEHCFNQAACFENMHNMCKVGGVMFSGVPMDGYLSHGFFNYHPVLFQKIAKVNDYKIEFMLIGGEDGFLPMFNLKNAMENRANVLNPSVGLVCIVGFRKINDEPFKYPYQDYSVADEAGWNTKIYTRNNAIINAVQSFQLNLQSAVVFGCGDASRIATRFLTLAGIDIEYYVDDFHNGLFLDKPIKKRCDLKSGSIVLFIGPEQKGDFDSFELENIRIVFLNDEFLLGYEYK